MPKDYTLTGPYYRSVLPTPFQSMQLVGRAQQAQQEREIEALKELRKENAKALDKAFDYQANPVISQYQDYFNNMVQEVYNSASQMSLTANPIENKKAVNQMIADIDGQLNIVKDVETRANEARLLAKSDPNRYNAEYVNNHIYDAIYDEKGNLIHPEDLDPEAPGRVFDDYRAYNIAGLNAEFAKSVQPDESFEFRTVTRAGIKYSQKFKRASKFVKLDKDGNAVFDEETGRLQMNVTGESVNLYLQDVGRRLNAEQLVKENQEAGNKNYTLKNAVEDLLQGTGYYKKSLADEDIIDKSQLNINFIGGSADKDRLYRGVAEYFDNLIHGDAQTKEKLLGDFQGRDWSTSFQQEVKDQPPSKSGYIVIDYDPANKAADFMASVMKSLGTDPGLLGDMQEQKKFYINLDNDEKALTMLNYWRNLTRNEDINPDFLRQAYGDLRQTKKGKEIDIGL